MLDVGWAELLVIAVVLIVVVGPKDLPRMLRTFGRTTQQMRRMAGDFRKQFDDALREAELDEMRQTVADARKLNPIADVKKVMNPMRAVGDEIRSSLAAATKAPEPKVPSATAPAAPSEPPTVGAPQPAAVMTAAAAAVPPASVAPASVPAPAVVPAGEPTRTAEAPAPVAAPAARTSEDAA